MKDKLMDPYNGTITCPFCGYTHEGWESTKGRRFCKQCQKDMRIDRCPVCDSELETMSLPYEKSNGGDCSYEFSACTNEDCGWNNA